MTLKFKFSTFTKTFSFQFYNQRTHTHTHINDFEINSGELFFSENIKMDVKSIVVDATKKKVGVFVGVIVVIV